MFIATGLLNLPVASIIPQPVFASLHKGYFLLKPQTAIISADKNAVDVADFLSELLYHNYGYSSNSNQGKVLSSSINTKAEIVLSINKKVNASIGNEGYTLKVTPKKIILSANMTKGLLYGVQTLIQLIPPKGNGYGQTKNIEFRIPCADITDYPRFGYRGMMLDVGRLEPEAAVMSWRGMKGGIEAAKMGQFCKSCVTTF